MEKFDPAAQLSSYRQTIDNIDAALVHMLAERFRCTDEVGLLKAEQSLPPVDEGREKRQYARLRKLAQEAELDEHFFEKLMKFIINEVIQRHNHIAAEHRARRVIVS
jgi:chorismate mutase